MVSIISMERVMLAAPYVALALLGLYALMGVVFDYHWRRFGVGLLSLVKFRLLYTVIGVVLFGLLFSSVPHA